MSGVPRAGSAEDCVGLRGQSSGKPLRDANGLDPSSELNEPMCGFLYRYTQHAHTFNNGKKPYTTRERMKTPFSATVS